MSESMNASISPSTKAPVTRKRIAVLIVTYNAENTLRRVLERIPAEVWEKVEEVFVFDDQSQDHTIEVGLEYRRDTQRKNLHIFRNDKTLGYGGNQIRGYQYAIQRGFDIVALLHGDGEYPPEALSELLEPLERDEADAVFGSRMVVAGAALKGGMPSYTLVGNRILSTLENALLGMGLTEFHSGYRLYSVAALKDVPFEKNTHDFHFDTQIIIQLHAAHKRIVEIPIPTNYGAQIRALHGIRYAKNVLVSLLRYRAHELGLTHRPEYAIAPTYNAKESPRGSHAQLVEMIPRTAKRVLDLGCGEGAISVALVERGHEVVSIDSQAPKPPLPHFIRADLTDEWPLAESHRFEAIVLADVLEHLTHPHELLLRTLPHLANRGRLFVSVPNVAHWSVRALVLSGRFDYTSRGILDEGHVRFFTRRSAEQMFRDVGLRVETYRATPVPWERVLPRALSTMVNVVEQADYALTRIQPGLFAYQHLFELVPNSRSI